MPNKPTKEMIENGKKQLDPRDVLRVVIQETPELRDPMIAAGVISKKED